MAKAKLSVRMISTLKAAMYFFEKTESSLYCWRVEKLGFKYTDAQKVKLHCAQDLHYQARALVKEVFQEMIGKQVVDEIS